MSGRPGFADLMKAQEHLGKARDAEQAAGNLLRADEINLLVVATFMAAIRAEDVDIRAGADR